jgi:hypothetical protein
MPDPQVNGRSRRALKPAHPGMLALAGPAVHPASAGSANDYFQIRRGRWVEA